MRIGIVLAGLLAACASTPKAPPKFDIEKTLGRERPAMNRVQLATPDGALTAMVESAGQPTYEAADGTTDVQIPIGTDAPLGCTVVPQRLDAGKAVSEVVARVKEKFDVEGIEIPEIAAEGGSPVMFANVYYGQQAPKGGGRLLGQVKVAVVPDDVSIVCLHDELGYAQTFRRIVKDLVRSRQIASDGDEPVFTEISIARANDVPIGFETRTVFEGDAGQQLVVALSSVVIPLSKTEIRALDLATIEASDPAGNVVEQRRLKLKDGTLQTDLSLAADDDGYAYEGLFDQAPISGRFDVKDPIPGLVREANLIRDFVGGKQPELAITEWDAAEDPTKLVPLRVTRHPAKDGWLSMQLGDRQLTGRADDQGMLVHEEEPLEKVTIVSERLWSAGKLPPLAEPETP